MSNRGEVGKFCWNELATNNVTAAKEFYTKAFGWKFTDHEIDGGVYSMVSTGDKEFAGFWQIPEGQRDQIPPHWMSYILVANLQESLDMVKKLGASLKVPVTQAGKYGQFAIIIDPTGAYVALWESFDH